VAKKGAICPIFEGDMPPKKCIPNIGANIGAITGILLRKESLHTQSFSELLTVLPIRYSVWAVVRFLNSFPAIRVLARIFYAYFLLVKKKIFK
jgi:hypothetical protein